MSESRFSMQARPEAISNEDLLYFQKYLLVETGIHVTPEKFFLLKSRLQSVLSKHGVAMASDLIAMVNRGALANQVKSDLINAFTTNETYWFRDSNQFNDLDDFVFPKLIAPGRGRPVRFWSAGCSTGQEPYSLSIAAHRFTDRNRLPGPANLKILGTDISPDVIDKARSACYSEKELQRGMPGTDIPRFFEPEGVSWSLRKELARVVEFRRFNLLDSFIPLGKFDVIFCRNVLIYFSDELKTKILAKFHEALLPDGFLFLSSTESLAGAAHLFQVHKESSHRFYTRVPAVTRK